MKSSINNVVLTIVSHRSSGDVVRKITNKGLLKVYLVAIGMMLLVGPGLSAMRSYAKQYDLDTRRPRMETLANAGKDTASLWLVQHYFKENQYRLPALVQKKYPEAMYYQGLFNIHKGSDKDSGINLVKEAAAQGFVPAINYVEINKL